MKKCLKIALALMMMIGFIQPRTVYAQPSMSITASSSQAYVGESVTVTVSVVGAGRVVVSGGAVSDNDWFENSSKSYEVTASAPGTVTITASSDNISDTTTEEEKPISGSVSITFVEKPTPQPQPEPEPEPEVKPEPEPEEEKSDDARLYSLYVDKGELSPAFSSDTTRYTVQLTDEQEIKLTAYGYHDKATVEGDGVKPLKVGNNSFTITVTAEDGKTKKEYTVDVNVKETPKATFEIDGKKYGVVTEGVMASVPKGFKETKVQIQDAVVTACKKDGITIVMLQDELGNTGYYIYNPNTKTIECEFKPIKLGSQELYIIDSEATAKEIKGMTLMTITTKAEEELLGYAFIENDNFEDYSVLHLKNSKNKNGYYIYNQETDEINAYPEESNLEAEAIKDYIETSMKEKTPFWIYAVIVVAVVAIIGGGVFIYLKKKGPKNPTPRDEDEDDDDIVETPKRHITDDTFFKEIPELDDDEKMSLEIQNALSDMKQGDFEKTIIASKETTPTPSHQEEPENEDEDDEWLDATMMDTIFGDED